jgi:predicted nucleic acid binding AN1-type Zn finger protein
MPLLSPVTTPKSKVTPACRDLEYFDQQLAPPPRKQQTDKKRCFDCSKKLGLLGIECKCGYVYCAGHRLPENHKCDFDHKRLGLDKLRQELKKVTKGKIEEI